MLRPARVEVAARQVARWAFISLTAVVLLLGAGSSHAAADEADADPRLTQAEAVSRVLVRSDVAAWLDRYPEDQLVPVAHYVVDEGTWEVGVFTPEVGKIVAAEVDDRTGDVQHVWVGPEVAWPLARGGGVGGLINEPLLWLAFSLFFLLGVADLRRPFSLANLDLLALLSFSVNVALVNEGRVFSSVVAAVVSLVYLIVRMVHVGVTSRPAVARSTAPLWLLVVGLVFVMGLRTGINVEQSTVLDVGYAGVIGADRLADGRSPYGSFPRPDTGTPCSLPGPDGSVLDWVQEDGRCESANPLGDTYGPVTYHAYLPGLWLFGWSGRWDFLPAVHATTLLFDLLTMAGLAAIGRRRGSWRSAVLLAFAWAANPLTQYTSSSNANDSILAALLVWGFWSVGSPPARGGLLALASWTKLAPLVLAPLWATYPDASRRKSPIRFAAAFVVATVLSFWVLLVQGDPWREVSTFVERTFIIQFDRTSPFSPWDWGQYAAEGLPDLSLLQHALQVLLVLAALLVAVRPRRKSPLQLAALSAALLMSFQLSLTHWSALYTVWFMPFVLLVVLAGDLLQEDVPRAETPDFRDALRRPRLED